MTEMAIQKYSFVNFPVCEKIEKYTDATKKIADMFLKTKNAVSVYTWGVISNPGISDIDFCIVMEGKLGNLPLNLRSFHFLDKSEKYVVVHPFIFVTPWVISEIEYVYPENNLVYFSGRKLKMKRLSPKDRKNAKISLLNDLIIRHFPRDYAKMIFSGKIDLRQALLRLKSLSTTIKTCREFGKCITAKEKKFISDTFDLRNNWFGMEHKEQERKTALLLEAGFGICFDIIEFFDVFLRKKKIVEIKSKNNIFEFRGDKNHTVFVDGWKRKNAVKLMKEKYSKNKEIISCLPVSLGIQLVEYSQSKGVIGDYISQNIVSSEINYDFGNSQIVKKRIQIFERQAELAERTKHAHFPAFFDFGYRTKSGAVNKLQNAVYSIRKK